jgi:hypothetical protein
VSAGVPCETSARSASATSALTRAPEMTTPTMVREVWMCPRARMWRTGVPAASLARALGEALVPERVEVCGDDAAAEASQAPNEDLAEWDGLAEGRPTTAAKIVTSAA